MAGDLMSVPECQARYCAGVADGPTGMCTAHRRALILVTKVQDAVREFLHNSNLTSTIKPTAENLNNVTRAGSLIAEGLALLVSSLFGSPALFEESPVISTSRFTWRVRFNWIAATGVESWDDDVEEVEDSDELGERDSGT